MTERKRYAVTIVVLLAINLAVVLLKAVIANVLNAVNTFGHHSFECARKQISGRSKSSKNGTTSKTVNTVKQGS